MSIDETREALHRGRSNAALQREIVALQSRVAALEHQAVVHVIVDQPVAVFVQPTPAIKPPATRAILTIGGKTVATLNIDKGGQAVTSFEDDKGDKDAVAPPNYVASFESSDPTVLTVDSSGKVTGLKEGTANVTDPINDANGVAIQKPDGSGTLGPATASVTIGPGGAVTASETVS